MTIGEVTRYAKAYGKKMRNLQKQQASFDYVQAMLIGRLVSQVLSGKGKNPSLYDVYPDLFEEERQQANINAFIARANAISKKQRKEKI